MSTSYKHALSFDSDPYSVTNFVDRMHGECSPLQWLRELVVNSVEAIAATGEGGKVFVHAIEQDMGEGVGIVRKLAVTDTGEGIAAGQLYSSFQVAMTSRGKGNYGIGAKIAALPMNPAGMIYRSQVEDEEPAELIWHKTGLTGYYAARDWTDEDRGELRYVTPPTCDESTYSDISDAGHGTQVVLCGEKPDEDTCSAFSPSPAKSAGNLHWAIRELNFKFWRFPKNITVRVQNAKVNGSDPDVKDYVVRGGEHGIRGFAEAQGIVDLDDNPYRILWYLLKENVVKSRNSHNGWSEGRTVATLYQENTGVIEVYAIRRTRRGAALMNDFGIYTGAERVVLLVEPKRRDLMQPTTSRSDLMVADEGTVSSAYKEIGQEFATLMGEKAPELATYVKQQLEGLPSTSDQKNLEEVIAKAIELYQIKNYRQLAKGKIHTGDGGEKREDGTRLKSNDGPESSPEPEREPPESNAEQRPRPRPTPRPRPRFHVHEDGTGRADKVPPNIEPKKFTWENLHSDDVTNYTTNAQRHVQVNTQGETYLRLLALYNSRPDFAQYSEVVEDVVRKRCEASLQLSIFTLEHEFISRGRLLGVDFDGYFEKNQGRVCLDAMASREMHNVIVRDIKNLIAKIKSQAAAETSALEKQEAA